MKAVLVHGYGDVNQLSYGDTPDLKPGPGEVLVRMAATSINPIDWKLRRGDLKAFMPLQFPAILGRDLAGEVVGLGDGVKTRKIGERVLGLVNHAYAEYVLCKADDLALIPSGLSFEQAAALPLVVLTGAQLIEKGIRPRSGETILITGSRRRSRAHRCACRSTTWSACNRGSALRAKERGGRLVPTEYWPWKRTRDR